MLNYISQITIFIVAVLAACTETRDAKTKKITKWGLTYIIVSTFGLFFMLIITWQSTSEAQRNSYNLRQTNQKLVKKIAAIKPQLDSTLAIVKVNDEDLKHLVSHAASKNDEDLNKIINLIQSNQNVKAQLHVVSNQYSSIRVSMLLGRWDFQTGDNFLEVRFNSDGSLIDEQGYPGTWQVKGDSLFFTINNFTVWEGRMAENTAHGTKHTLSDLTPKGWAAIKKDI